MEKPKEAVCREESDASLEDKTNHSSASSGFKEKEDDDRPMEASAAAGIKKNDAGFILALCGDAGSIVTGSKNILIPQKEHTNFSSMLYDLCGRHISVINLLGQQDIIDIEETTLNKGIDAFLLLIPNGLHENHYKSGLQWLEKTFGRESLPYVMTVVTRSLGEKCEDALKDLKAHESFAENRYHVCIRSMSEAEEIAELLVKIEIMVSENNPSCFTGRICGGNREQKEDLEPEHHGYKSMESAVPKENQTGQEVEMSAAKRKATANKQRPASPKNDNDSAANKTGRSDKNLGQNIEKKVKKDDGIPQHSQHQTEIETLLNRLQLKEKFPRKMSPGDFLHIGLPLTPDHDMSEKNLAYSFLQKLIKLDHRARYIPVKQESLEVTHAKHAPDSDGNDSDENDLDYFLSSSSETSEPAQTHIHPMDVQMAVFHCSDSYLRQIMVTKLSQCQYALPFLVPDPLTMEIECPLWAFRQITKTWKETKGDSHTTTMNIQICNAKTPLVSFFRLGSLSVSKSQLMNSLINDRHSTFFHRHSPGSTKTRHLLDGVAEITWYCPNGKPNDAFNNCIAFCNLHGDAVMIEKQRQILTEMSSINVVMVNYLQKDDKSWPVISALLRSKKPLICLLVKDDCKVMESKKGKFKMGLKDRNQADVSKELKRIIQELLSSDDPLILKTIFQLETMVENTGIQVDESDDVCQNGKLAAVEIVNLLPKNNILSIKDKFLPCQGHLWHEWCKTNKELHRLTGNIENDKSQKEQEMTRIREKQCAASCSNLMKLFTKSLFTLPLKDKEYFLKWTQILTDDLSTDSTYSIIQSYDRKWSEVLALKNRPNKPNNLEKEEKELESLSKQLQSATFGLEHIFREMGQIYEAYNAIYGETREGEWRRYPELAAGLLISGHPLELMDGDAGHVPLKWISTVLDKVKMQLGDLKVFVLSVLGLQSSGKSTMLNTMFGLQFAVSAGRCTKGAFMQLIKISKEIRQDFNFDYFLVVDTEGLRALELESSTTPNHDNELATFVVGVGNLTLINIFGENPTEMQNVLQIVVQAFMRMKKIRVSPSCVFVHQNVTDVAAAERNMDGRRRLQEKLDQMVQLAAKEEDCDVSCFSEMIEFDIKKDVHYLAQLWEGSPPMAPPNPGYSESIRELRKHILSKASRSNGISLSHLKAHVQDLWEALLDENFVFSFKNTLEMAVYREMEVEYGNWTWHIRKDLLTIENQLYNRIENGDLNKLDLSSISTETSKTCEEIKEEMIKYFENEEKKEILAQWKGRFENKLKEFHDEQVREVQGKLQGVIQRKNTLKKVDSMKKGFEEKLLQKSKDISEKLKDKAKDETELKKEFDSVWENWVLDLTKGLKPIEDINLENDLFNILKNLGIEEKIIKECKYNGRYKVIPKIDDYSSYLNNFKMQKTKETTQESYKKEDNLTNKQANPLTELKTFWKSVTLNRSNTHEALSSDQRQIREMIDMVATESISRIKKKPVETNGYQLTYLEEMVHLVKEKVAKLESYAFRKEFTVDLILHVFHLVKGLLLESQEKYRNNNDAFIYLESKKMHYYNIFKIYFNGNSSAVVLGEMICEKLRPSIIETAYTKTAMALAGEMKCNVPAFSGNRLDLEKNVLRSLAERENFDEFMKYIQHPRDHVEDFIKAEVHQHISTDYKDKAKIIHQKNVEDIYTVVSQALFTATQKVQTQRGGISMWLSELSVLLKDQLKFDSTGFKNFRDINDFDFLCKEANKKLKLLKEQLVSFSVDEMKTSRQTPEEILISQLCNCCWVKCPFCLAVCTNTLEDHSPDDHSVPFHRSSAVSGMYHANSNIMSIDFCTSRVASNLTFYPYRNSKKPVPCKQYRSAGPEYASWRITPDESKLAYWKWFVCRFKKNLEEKYRLKFYDSGEIPENWKTISKAEALKCLDDISK